MIKCAFYTFQAKKKRNQNCCRSAATDKRDAMKSATTMKWNGNNFFSHCLFVPHPLSVLALQRQFFHHAHDSRRNKFAKDSNQIHTTIVVVVVVGLLLVPGRNFISLLTSFVSSRECSSSCSVFADLQSDSLIANHNIIEYSHLNLSIMWFAHIFFRLVQRSFSNITVLHSRSLGILMRQSNSSTEILVSKSLNCFLSQAKSAPTLSQKHSHSHTHHTESINFSFICYFRFRLPRDMQTQIYVCYGSIRLARCNAYMNI